MSIEQQNITNDLHSIEPHSIESHFVQIEPLEESANPHKKVVGVKKVKGLSIKSPTSS
jgi:hypothetical protein